MATSKTLVALAAAGLPSIEVYKADLATPVEFEAMRFWVQGELTRIQNTSYSTEEAVKVLAQAIEGLQGGGGGADGAPGAPGRDGVDGRGVQVFKGPDGAVPGGAQPGDVWLVEECS